MLVLARATPDSPTVTPTIVGVGGQAPRSATTLAVDPLQPSAARPATRPWPPGWQFALSRPCIKGRPRATVGRDLRRRVYLAGGIPRGVSHPVSVRVCRGNARGVAVRVSRGVPRVVRGTRQTRTGAGQDGYGTGIVATSLVGEFHKGACVGACRVRKHEGDEGETRGQRHDDTCVGSHDLYTHQPLSCVHMSSSDDYARVRAKLEDLKRRSQEASDVLPARMARMSVDDPAAHVDDYARVRARLEQLVEKRGA